MDNIILCGMQFGDEGKGSFVDFLTHEQNVDCIIRYNGGSQASHTVTTPKGIVHKFSQLGSGMFNENCHTYLTENMVVNLDNLLNEMVVFLSKTNITMQELKERIHIHENCFVVTPYHKLINKLREFSLGKNRRGTVGTGVSEVKYLLAEPKTFPYEQPLGLRVKDIYNPHSNNPVIGRFKALQVYVHEFYESNKKIIWDNVPKEMKIPLHEEINCLLSHNAFFTHAANCLSKFKYAPPSANLESCVYSTYENTIFKNYSKAIFEGAQGLLIDAKYGIKPNTTYLDTTNNFALGMSYYRDKISTIGITKAFCSRHGKGIFPTEDYFMNTVISDENQEETFWNGKIRFGWFDGVLFRYAQSINKVEEVYLSSLDKLSRFETIKVCNEYMYSGTIDSRFKQLFDYYISDNGETIITSIRENGEDLIKYLNNCTPIYIELHGWKTDISNILSFSQLPANCLNYICLLQTIMQVPITLISVGPTRNNKIRR